MGLAVWCEFMPYADTAERLPALAARGLGLHLAIPVFKAAALRLAIGAAWRSARPAGYYPGHPAGRPST